MTILERRKLETENAYMNIHEASCNLTTSAERCAWIYQEILRTIQQTFCRIGDLE